MRFVFEFGGNRNLTGTSWNRLRSIVKKGDKAICQYCGRKAEDGHVDHIIPLSRGGTDRLDNLAWSCSECNQRKNARLPLIPPHPRPIFRLLFAGLVELILEKLVGRYQDDYDCFWTTDEEDPLLKGWVNNCNREFQETQNKIAKMKSQRVRDWVRKTVWPDEYPIIEFDESILDGIDFS